MRVEGMWICEYFTLQIDTCITNSSLNVQVFKYLVDSIYILKSNFTKLGLVSGCRRSKIKTIPELVHPQVLLAGTCQWIKTSWGMWFSTHPWEWAGSRVTARFFKGGFPKQKLLDFFQNQSWFSQNCQTI